MRGNGGGGTESGAEGGPPSRMTVEEAFALMASPRNALDKLAQFVRQQLHHAVPVNRRGWRVAQSDDSLTLGVNRPWRPNPGARHGARPEGPRGQVVTRLERG
jgi:hypothetical protein